MVEPVNFGANLLCFTPFHQPPPVAPGIPFLSSSKHTRPHEQLYTYIYLEPQSTRNNWMFQYGNEGPLHSKWSFVETSINFWLFGVPDIHVFFSTSFSITHHPLASKTPSKNEEKEEGRGPELQSSDPPWPPTCFVHFWTVEARRSPPPAGSASALLHRSGHSDLPDESGASERSDATRLVRGTPGLARNKRTLLNHWTKDPDTEEHVRQKHLGTQTLEVSLSGGESIHKCSSLNRKDSSQAMSDWIGGCMSDSRFGVILSRYTS